MRQMKEELDLDLDMFGLSPKEKDSVKYILENPKAIWDSTELFQHRKLRFQEFIKKLSTVQEDNENFIKSIVQLVEEFSSDVPKTVLVGYILKQNEVSKFFESLRAKRK